MAVAYTVVYEARVVAEDIPALSHVWKERIKSAIEAKLIREPEVFGKPLRRSLKNYRKLRVGDYRVIFRIHKQEVRVFCIGHRSRVYERAHKRVS